jgi:hypothetical protein
MSTAIVAPVHIPVSKRWTDALVAVSQQAEIIIVDDSDGKVDLPKVFDVYDYKRQKQELGPELYLQFEQFHKSSSCKNFGTWLAYNTPGITTVIVIDSDCVIPEGFIEQHRSALSHTGDVWANPLRDTGWYSRGYPHHLRNVESWANMGLWTNELDLYGSDRVAALPRTPPAEPQWMNRQVASFFPLSGMNVAFRREAIPYMLFLPNFLTYTNERFIRHDDIWGGYIFQKAALAHNKVLSFGRPMVYHETVVHPQEDAAEEVPMLKYEKQYYRAVDAIMGQQNVQDSAAQLFGSLARWIPNFAPFSNLRPAFQFWRDAFPEERTSV